MIGDNPLWVLYVLISLSKFIYENVLMFGGIFIIIALFRALFILIKEGGN